MILPQRPFSQPLPRALVEQRRLLNFQPMDVSTIRLAIDALLFEPERNSPRAWGDYIALDMIRTGLRTARNDDKLRAVADQIYELALYLENGDMTDAERRLREAEARLRDALERGASLRKSSGWPRNCAGPWTSSCVNSPSATSVSRIAMRRIGNPSRLSGC